MKKILVSIMTIVMSVMMLTACGPENNVAPTPTTDATADATMPQNTATATADASKFIGEEKAKELALQKAGINAEGVTFDRIELDRDDGVWQYEVDFRHEGTEYDIDIKADNGEILSFEKENKEAF